MPIQSCVSRNTLIYKNRPILSGIFDGPFGRTTLPVTKIRVGAGVAVVPRNVAPFQRLVTSQAAPDIWTRATKQPNLPSPLITEKLNSFSQLFAPHARALLPQSVTLAFINILDILLSNRCTKLVFC